MGKKVMFINTETTGLPKKDLDKVDEETVDIFPRMVSFHMKVGEWNKKEKKMEIEKKLYCIVKPDEFTIPKFASKINMISQKDALEKGSDIRKILDIFVENLDGVKFLAGHNVMFDINVLQAELIRYGYDTDLYQYKTIDTINFGHEYDYPKLDKLHKLLFGQPFKKSHPRKSNINVIIKCFEKLYHDSMN